MPHARLAVIRDSRHATNMDQPEAFNRAVEEFLLDREGAGGDEAA